MAFAVIETDRPMTLLAVKIHYAAQVRAALSLSISHTVESLTSAPECATLRVDGAGEREVPCVGEGRVVYIGVSGGEVSLCEVSLVRKSDRVVVTNGDVARVPLGGGVAVSVQGEKLTGEERIRLVNVRKLASRPFRHGH